MEELMQLLAKRDNITFYDARLMIDKCIIALNEAIDYGDNEDCEQIIYEYLGLEPDYLPILLEEII